jgi:hypothetical protein
MPKQFTVPDSTFAAFVRCKAKVLLKTNQDLKHGPLIEYLVGFWEKHNEK